MVVQASNFVVHSNVIISSKLAFSYSVFFCTRKQIEVTPVRTTLSSPSPSPIGVQPRAEATLPGTACEAEYAKYTVVLYRSFHKVSLPKTKRDPNIIDLKKINGFERFLAKKYSLHNWPSWRFKFPPRPTTASTLPGEWKNYWTNEIILRKYIM